MSSFPSTLTELSSFVVLNSEQIHGPHETEVNGEKFSIKFWQLYQQNSLCFCPIFVHAVNEKPIL